jgi:hypothetical protein
MALRRCENVKETFPGRSDQPGVMKVGVLSALSISKALGRVSMESTVRMPKMAEAKRAASNDSCPLQPRLCTALRTRRAP